MNEAPDRWNPFVQRDALQAACTDGICSQALSGDRWPLLLFSRSPGTTHPQVFASCALACYCLWSTGGLSPQHSMPAANVADTAGLSEVPMKRLDSRQARPHASRLKDRACFIRIPDTARPSARRVPDTARPSARRVPGMLVSARIPHQVYSAWRIQTGETERPK